MSKHKGKHHENHCKDKTARHDAGVTLGASKHDTIDTRETYTQGAYSPNEQRNIFYRFFDWFERHSNAVIASFTAVIAFVGILQWIVIGGQLDEMRSDQRAWIKAANEPVQFTEGSVVMCQVNLLNPGKMPARHIDAHFLLELVDSRSAPHFEHYPPDTATSDLTTGIIFPNDSVALPTILFTKDGNILHPHILTHDEVTNFLGGKTYISVYGKATFDDVYGIQHWVHFCHFYATTGIRVEAKSCTDYNDAN